MERVDYQKVLVQDLLNYHRNGELNLTPWYQRRSVWKTPQQAYLINTILESKPIPSIYIRHSVDLEQEKSVREVVDGQQRIKSIIAFKDDEFPVRIPSSKKKLKFSELTLSDKKKFLYTELSVGILIGAEEQDVIDIFGRINSISKNLNAQEKRNAEFSGEYKQFSLKKSSELLDFWRTRNVFSATDISRMREVEFLSDLTMNLLSGLSDYSANKLNEQYRKYDDEFKDWDRAEKLIDTIFAKLIALPTLSIADTIFSRPPYFLAYVWSF